jgi:drug/metabolite transporter (DMT)-like permease
LFGLLAALGYGGSPLLVRAAIGGTGLPIVGAMVSYMAATAVLLLSLALPGQWARVHGMDRRALWWFLAAGLTVFFAQMFRYIALDLGPVTVMSPLQQTGILFTLLLSFLVNRHLESFGPRVIAGMALTMAGSVAVVLKP